jgi:ABC-type glycerol-3-phosphate transport system substrate-binding protein
MEARGENFTRRQVLRGAGGIAVGALAAQLLEACGGGSKNTTPASSAGGVPNVLRGTELKILVWSHFVPRFDDWFDPFAKAWGDANGVRVSVDHINNADLRPRTAAEIGAGQGHDLIELIDPPADYEPSMLDLTDINKEAQKRWGDQVPVAKASSFNPKTNVYYGFCHAWVPDPGDYRKSMWEKVGYANGPKSWSELLDGGRRIKREQGVQMGIGMSNEIDSNMAARAMIWSFGGSIQDKNEKVVINSSETVAAVEYMTQLYKDAMTPEVFGWNAASNNQALVAGQASWILNSISAYRTAQKTDTKVSDDIFFTSALEGPKARLASEHLVGVYIIPKFAKNPQAGKEFLLHLVENYKDATYNSELYNFPAFPSTVPDLTKAGGWLDSDPFGSNPKDKLSLLKNAQDWSTNVGYPGPANAAEGEVFATFVLPQMMAKAAMGQLSAKDAVAQAETQINAIYKKWRDQGLIGGA